MQTFFYTLLFILGLMMGSFGSVLIYRLKSGKKGIMMGRSECGGCKRILQATDLIPVLSWVLQKGKCKKCGSKISVIYPILEISTGILFTMIGYFLIDIHLLQTGNTVEIWRLIFWLAIGFITILYTFYDILYMEIHEGIMGAGVSIASLGVFIHQYMYYNAYISIHLTSAIIFILSLFGLYIIMLKGLKEIWDFVILLCIGGVMYAYAGVQNIFEIPLLSSLLGALIFFLFFFIQIVISKGKWMGGGDLRIGIMAGILLGYSYAFSGIMATYMVGSIIGIGVILYSKITNKNSNTSTQIPFGPFIAIGSFIILFFQNQVSHYLYMYF